MAKLHLDYVNSSYDARGKLRHVFLRKGHKRVTIKGKAGNADFMAHYHELLAATESAPSTIGCSKALAGTVDHAVIAFLCHDDFMRGLSKATQGAWRPILTRFREHTTPSGRTYGQNQISTLTRQAIMAFLDGKKPSVKKNELKPVRAVIRFALTQGWMRSDPTEGLRLKAPPKSMGHLTWKEPQIAQYRARHALGTIARLALELLLNIAARRHDAHLIGRQNITNGKLTWRPVKTERSTAKLLTIKILPELQAALDAVPESTRASGVLAFLVNEYGKPFATPEVLGKSFARWCREAGLEPVVGSDGLVRNYRAHGLRKAALRHLAHRGATASEMQAVSGHSSLAQLQEYLQEVEQERLAEAALARLENR
jgi:integrase